MTIYPDKYPLWPQQETYSAYYDYSGQILTLPYTIGYILYQNFISVDTCAA